jgi:hypothetical protein
MMLSSQRSLVRQVQLKPLAMPKLRLNELYDAISKRIWGAGFAPQFYSTQFNIEQDNDQKG